MLRIRNNPMIAEASAIKVVGDADDNIALVYLQGPMSMVAAGAFIHAVEEQRKLDLRPSRNKYLQLAQERFKGEIGD